LSGRKRKDENEMVLIYCVNAAKDGDGTVEVHPPKKEKKEKKGKTKIAANANYEVKDADDKTEKDNNLNKAVVLEFANSYMDEAGTSKHKYGLQDELTAIYRKDCTIRIPFLSVSCLEPRVLLSMSAEDNDVRGTLTNLTGKEREREARSEKRAARSEKREKREAREARSERSEKREKREAREARSERSEKREKRAAREGSSERREQREGNEGRAASKQINLNNSQSCTRATLFPTCTSTNPW
jgi:hypothetical protein